MRVPSSNVWPLLVVRLLSVIAYLSYALSMGSGVDRAKGPRVGRRRRMFRILRLFFRLVLDFLFQYARACVVGSPYDFFQDHVRNRKRAIRIRDTALQMGG